MKLFNKMAVGTVVAGLLAVQAQGQEDRGIMSQKRAYKGYEKRDRIMPGISSTYVSPSQLHEVYGWEAGAAATFDQATSTVEGAKTRTSTPGVVVNANYGGDVVVFGLGLNYKNLNNKGIDDNTAAPEFVDNAYVVKPALALSLTDNITFGVSSALSMDQIKFTTADNTEDKINYQYAINTAGISVHTSKMEAGVAYSAYVKATEKFDTSKEEQNLYLPAQSAMFVRGNMTDSLSLMGTASFVDYERKALASNEAFAKYHLADRLGTALTLTYWTEARSNVSVTGKYSPATAATTVLDMGDLANTYGGSIDYVRSFGKQQYLGFTAGFERGERDETLQGQRFSAQDEKFTVGATFNAKM